MPGKKQVNEIGWNLKNSYVELPDLLFTLLKPTPVSSPKLVFLNHSLAKGLGLNKEGLSSEKGVAVLAGNYVPDGALPLSQAYSGHQFGFFTNLGDGRAHLLGEQITPSGKRFDIQLKGSGRSPYSRQGDGRSPLGPVLREYLISEAMHALNIPTTRSLAVVETGESVIRETVQKGAVLTRVASSHLRVGTFEYVSRRGSPEDLQALANYALRRHFPEFDSEENRYLFLLKEVIKRQAVLIARWQLVGFIHGVMNTDNTAISGETLDYGPCAFMDVYDPATVFSSIDTQGRYSYGNQPQIAAWNLARFAETLLPLLHKKQEQAVQMAQDAISGFTDLYNSKWLGGMRAKLGIFKKEKNDETLIKDLLRIMQKHCADFTNTFRALMFDGLEKEELFTSKEFAKWRERWLTRLERQEEPWSSSQELMRGANPALIPRNHIVESALNAAVNNGDYKEMEKLLKVLEKPYTHSPQPEDYYTQPLKSKHPYRTYCGT